MSDEIFPADDRVAELKRAIEAVVLVAQDPVAPEILAQLLEQPVGLIERWCGELAAEYSDAGRGFELVRVAGGYRYQTHAELTPYVERFVLHDQKARLSGAALETLAIIAYKQPISRAQVASIRGVDPDGVIRTLQARGYIGETGRDDGPGQAVLFGTTEVFLEKLGLDSLDDLPPIAEFIPGADVVETLEQGLRVDPGPDASTPPTSPSPGVGADDAQAGDDADTSDDRSSVDPASTVGAEVNGTEPDAADAYRGYSVTSGASVGSNHDTDTASREPSSAERPEPDSIGAQAGSADTGSTDTGSTDTGPTDTGPTDTGSTDAGSGAAIEVDSWDDDDVIDTGWISDDVPDDGWLATPTHAAESDGSDQSNDWSDAEEPGRRADPNGDPHNAEAYDAAGEDSPNDARAAEPDDGPGGSPAAGFGEYDGDGD